MELVSTCYTATAPADSRRGTAATRRGAAGGAPEAEARLLPEGTHLLALTQPRARRLRLTLTLPTGWRTVSAEDRALLRLLRLLIRQDSLTTCRSDRDRELTLGGMSLHVQTEADRTQFLLTAPAAPLQPAAELLLDVAFLPAMRQEQIDAQVHALRAAAPHAALPPSLGAEDLRAEHRRLFSAEHGLLVASGPGSASAMIHDLTAAVRAVLAAR
ncbi:hypothetical protein [Serinibacter salmoneus]|uniref:Uncharacterized protein n=1 Tax=Serinibacter salmoneus TaxID=556530 RepID=A0A2A9CX19_9MICO|nr:hypothetical protein [Serinibacter salmoneus]PFG18555.1 hypothetical protein ATL40_0095 [Serinibacter salmoneus]